MRETVFKNAIMVFLRQKEPIDTRLFDRGEEEYEDNGDKRHVYMGIDHSSCKKSMVLFFFERLYDFNLQLYE